MTARPWIQKLILVLGAALLLAAFCSPAHAADSWAKPLALYGTCATADLLSTEYAMSRGNVERNPLMQQRGARVALKAAQVAGLTLLDREIARRSLKAARVLRVAAILIHGYVVVHNMRLPRQAGR